MVGTLQFNFKVGTSALFGAPPKPRPDADKGA
jgi:hypothetical protein